MMGKGGRGVRACDAKTLLFYNDFKYENDGKGGLHLLVSVIKTALLYNDV